MNINKITSNCIGHKLNRGKGYWVTQNEDGTLYVTLDGKERCRHTGSLIVQLGGVEATLAACEQKEMTLGEYCAELKSKADVSRFGEEPNEEQKQKNKEFYEYLLSRNVKAHVNDKGQWVLPKYICTEHHPANGYEGVRFKYPFTDVRFDSVRGWQVYKLGWYRAGENNKRIIQLRIHFGLLPENDPTPNEVTTKDGYKLRYEEVLADMERKEGRDKEITEAYNAIKDLRPVPATIENIKIILRYYKMLGYVGDLLPMTIGYSCNSYDCDGKLAIAIKLDEPIVYNEDGDMHDRFSYCAPLGYLRKYKRV